MLGWADTGSTNETGKLAKVRGGLHERMHGLSEICS